VSFGWDTMQTKQNTHLPLVSWAQCNRYWLPEGVGRCWRWGGKRSEGGRCLQWASPSGGEEATLGGLPLERGRRNNGCIMGGRGSGVDGWRKRRWMREDGGCGASDCSTVMVSLLVMFWRLRSSTIRGNWWFSRWRYQ
jgi:hypothetical protein